MDLQMIILGAATLLSGIHGNNGNHTVDTIKNAVSVAVIIAQEAEAMLAAIKAKQPPQP